jgi:two-component system phosphate regulon sensor histidine kinase PhoR
MSGEQVVKRLLGRRRAPEVPSDSHREVERARALVEESRELVIVLDQEDRVVAASRRARESVEGLQEGARAPETVLAAPALVVPYEVGGHGERLLYLRRRGDMAAYEELRAGFTAAVSHELRTPLARVLALLETALLPGADTAAIIEQAQAEVGQIGELIDDVLFLSELESGRELVGLGSTPPLPVLREVAAELAESAARAGVTLLVDGDEDAELPLRPRMIRVVAENLLENAIRYAGAGATARLSVERSGSDVVLIASDDGVGVTEVDLPRLFERFYRSDRARASRGTGLGLAIVKHVVTSAGGTVEAEGARGQGLTVRCVFTTS